MDGKTLVLVNEGDLSLLPLDGKARSTPLMQTAFNEGVAEIFRRPSRRRRPRPPAWSS
jgi:hypothetical protein